MSDSIRLLYNWSALRVQNARMAGNAGQILRHDPFSMPAQLIARHELRVWFEPDWHQARLLARRFPHCLICSIPVESNTENLRRVPGWRPRRANGVL